MSEKKLAHKYPDIYKLWHKEPDEIDGPAPQISSYGFQHGKGWHNIIECLCETLERMDVQITVMQQKEKYGGLRFYHSGIKSDDEGDTYMAMGAIRNARNMSYHICEECGSSAELRRQGWLRTLCDECWSEKKSRQRTDSERFNTDTN